MSAAQTQFTDPAKESALIGFIIVGRFTELPIASRVVPEVFTSKIYRIAYRAAMELDAKGELVVEASINDWIEAHDLGPQIQMEMGGDGTVSWRCWSQGIDESLQFSPNTLGAEYYLSELLRFYKARESYALKKRWMEEDLSKEQVDKEWYRIHGTNGKPGIIAADKLCHNGEPYPPVLIEGVLHQGSKMVLGGGSKSFKTWMLLELAVAGATGGRWLGFNVAPGKVAYLNFELPEFAMKDRIAAICKAKGVDIPHGLKVWNLRGHAAKAEVILPELAGQLKGRGFTMAFIDPLYKLRAGSDDNSAGVMTTIMNSLDEFSKVTGASTIYGEHFAKGDAGLKDPIDRISGSGVQARDPDAIILCTKHAAEEAFTMEFVLRCFPPVESFVVVRKHPLMEININLDPEDLKQPKARAKAKAGGQFKAQYTKEHILARMNILEPKRTGVLFREVREETGMSKAEFYRLWEEMKANSDIRQTEGGWCRF